MESFRELNADIIDLDWQVDIAHARQILGTDVVLGGNINPVLVQNNSGLMRYEISKALVNQYRNEKIPAGSDAKLLSYTPPENLMAMRKASL